MMMNRNSSSSSSSKTTTITSSSLLLQEVQQEEWYQQSLLVLVVGASGDLAKKKTYPSLYELWKHHYLPGTSSNSHNNKTSDCNHNHNITNTNTTTTTTPTLRICGFARTQQTNEQLRAHIKPYLMASAALKKRNTSTTTTITNSNTKNNDKEDDDIEEEEQSIDMFLTYCTYYAGISYGDSETIYEILSKSESQSEQQTTITNLIVYLAIPSNVFSDSCLAVQQALCKIQSIHKNGRSTMISIQQQPFLDDTTSTNMSMNQIPTLNDKKNGFVRIVLEKPFGNDTTSCYELNDLLKQQGWLENHLYRIDHYLGKNIIQNILPTLMKQDHICFQQEKQQQQIQPPSQQNNTSTSTSSSSCDKTSNISMVHVICKEPFGTDGRGGYFDSYGIIRDIIQNHLLQIISLIGVGASASASTNPNNNKDTSTSNKKVEDGKSHDDWIRDAKVQVLQNIKPIHCRSPMNHNIDDDHTTTYNNKYDEVLLGQYIDYSLDPTINNNPYTITPTYACIPLRIGDTIPYWKNTIFLVEAGKALNEHLCEARIYYHHHTNNNNINNNNMNEQQQQQLQLVFRVQPNPAIYMTSINTNTGMEENIIPISRTIPPAGSGSGVNTSGDNSGHSSSSEWEAYTTLLLDVLRGKQSNFVRDDELITAWEIVTPLLHQLDEYQLHHNHSMVQQQQAQQEQQLNHHEPMIRSSSVSDVSVDRLSLNQDPNRHSHHNHTNTSSSPSSSSSTIRIVPYERGTTGPPNRDEFIQRIMNQNNTTTTTTTTKTTTTSSMNMDHNNIVAPPLLSSL